MTKDIEVNLYNETMLSNKKKLSPNPLNNTEKSQMYYAKLKNTVSKGTYCMTHLHGFPEKVKLWDSRPVGCRGIQGLRCGEGLMMKGHGKIWGVIDLFYILTVVVIA